MLSNRFKYDTGVQGTLKTIFAIYSAKKYGHLGVSGQLMPPMCIAKAWLQGPFDNQFLQHPQLHGHTKLDLIPLNFSPRKCTVNCRHKPCYPTFSDPHNTPSIMCRSHILTLFSVQKSGGKTAGHSAENGCLV